MDSPSWQLPLFQRSTQDERGEGEGGGRLGTAAPCRMRSLYSSSSGPVVLEGWLLQANAKNCKPGNTSVQLGSLYGMKRRNPPASGGMRVWDKERTMKGKEKTSESGTDTNRGKRGGCEASDCRHRSQNFLSPSAPTTSSLNQKQPSDGKGIKGMQGNSPSAITPLVSLQLYHSRCLSPSIFIQV